MKSLIHNKTFHKYLIGVFAMFIVLIPFLLLFVDTSFAQVAQTNTGAGAKPPAVDWLDQLGQTIGNIILGVAALVTWVGAMILKFSIEKLVLGMGDMLINQGLGAVIDTMWTTVRDICNLAFIFGFIFIGIRTIIDSESAGTKKVLASIVIGALLINFSLFFSKAIIDVSNYLAVEIHNTMMGNYQNKDVSEQIGKLLGIQTIYKIPDPNTLSNVTGGGSIAFYVMGAIFLIVAGFVLAAGGILLIIRFVALLFIMIFSPVLFAATVFPQTAKYSSLLWSKLISYAFFAPAYLFLLFVSMQLLAGATTGLNANGKTLAGAFTNKAGMFDVVIIFIICIMALIMSLKIAQQLSFFGADKAIGFAKVASGRATAGVLAATGRATAGRIAHEMSESATLKDRASQRGIRGWTARQQLKVSRKVGDASFDARNIAGAGKALGIGEGRKGGYSTVMHEVEEKEMKFAKSLGEVGDSDVRVEARKKESEALEKEIRLKRDERSSLKADDVDGKQKLATEIRGLEEKQKKASEKYQQEKPRRILGSTFGETESSELVETARVKLEEESKKVKDAWKEYEEMWKEGSDTGLISIAHKKIQELKEQEAEAKERYKTAQSKVSKNEGYAAVLKNSHFYESWPAGRLVVQNTEAGEAIEKAFEKKVKKSKEDSRTDSIVDAVKSSKT